MIEFQMPERSWANLLKESGGSVVLACRWNLPARSQMFLCVKGVSLQVHALTLRWGYRPQLSLERMRSDHIPKVNLTMCYGLRSENPKRA